MPQVKRMLRDTRILAIISILWVLSIVLTWAVMAWSAHATSLDATTVPDVCPIGMTDISGATRPLWYCQHVNERLGHLHGTRCVLLGEPLPIPGGP